MLSKYLILKKDAHERIVIMNYYSEYKKKLRSPEDAARIVKNGDWIDYNFGLSMPGLMDKALAARKHELKDIKVRGLLALRPIEIVENDLNRDTFTYMSWHFGNYERKLCDCGLCDYIPMVYRNKPDLYRKHLEVDVAIVSVAPMDRHGYFNFSLTNSATKAILEKANVVIVEVNSKFPKALGGREECIHIAEVDVVVEGENEAPIELKPTPINEVDKAVAKHIVKEIESGSTIQLGIGSMPNAVGKMIANSDLKDLGMHTEMLADAYLDIFKSGKLTNNKKNIDKGKGVWSFCVGSKELYDWIDENPGLASYPVNYTNSPEIMSQNDKLITINNCIEVDIYGQVSSESSAVRQISGTGGQLDFLSGGFMSNKGKSFICMASTYMDKKTMELKSRIVPNFPIGEIVTDPRSQAYYLVTEYGIANLAGRSTWERAERIIGLAHPDFREELIKSAEKMNIWRRSNR